MVTMSQVVDWAVLQSVASAALFFVGGFALGRAFRTNTCLRCITSGNYRIRLALQESEKSNEKEK